MMRTGVTASGFAWQLDDAVLNNMELDTMRRLQDALVARGVIGG